MRSCKKSSIILRPRPRSDSFFIIVRTPPGLSSLRQAVADAASLIIATFPPSSLSKTKYITDRLRKNMTNLRQHLQDGCVSDPDPRDVPLYHWSGRTAAGADTYRSSRGTNRVETYHTPIRRIFSGYRTSPRMAHSILLTFNYRRNHRMAGALALAPAAWS